MIHTNMPRNWVVFLLTRRLTRSAIYGSQFDSHKWPTALVRTVKGKPRNFEANLCGSLYSTFKTSFQPYAFYKKWLQTLFIDQLDRSKATCSFNCLPLSQFLAAGVWFIRWWRNPRGLSKTAGTCIGCSMEVEFYLHGCSNRWLRLLKECVWDNVWSIC